MKSTPTNAFALDKSLSFLITIGLVAAMILMFENRTAAQTVIGNSTPVSSDSANRADQRIKGAARVNPRTLALEFTLSLMSYPGRNGHGVNASLSYSSKVWRMNSGTRWWYWNVSGRKYVTDLTARYSERSAAGWTSGLSAPVLEDMPQIYDENGNPYVEPFGSAAAMDQSWAEAERSGLSGLMPDRNFRCVSYQHVWCPDCQLPDGSEGAHIFICNAWEVGPGIPEPTNPGEPPEEIPENLYYAARLFVSMPGGQRHELRKDDSRHVCGIVDYVCEPETDGVYYATDGTGMRLERSNGGSVLYLRDGSKYLFPPGSANHEGGRFAERFVDRNGNTISYNSEGAAPGQVRKIVDTLGREITDPIPRNYIAQTQTSGSKNATFPWFGGRNQDFEVTWAKLKPEGCEASDDPDCVGRDGTRGGALEDPTELLGYDARYFCQGGQSEDLEETGPQDVLFPLTSNGVRSCSTVTTEASTGNLVPARFNPVVLRRIMLPNGQSYQFGYNRYGEISRIDYPTGIYEEFDHDTVTAIGGTGIAVYDQTNRGVVERRLYGPDGTLNRTWKYTGHFDPVPGGLPKMTVISTSSRSDDPQADGARTETVMSAYRGSSAYGFNSPESGSILETRRFDENGQLLSRSLFEWTAVGPMPGGETNAKRDLRISRTVEFTFEPGSPKALAILKSNEYETPYQRDPGFFAHLNRTRNRTWKFSVFDAPEAVSIDISTAAAAIVSSSEVRTNVSTQYLYETEYLGRGITGMVESEKIHDPREPGIVLNETRFEYDLADLPPVDPGNTNGWTDPATTFRGNVSRVDKLDTATGDWLSERFQYDKYGNTIKSWDASGDTERYSAIEFSAEYGFAFPTSVSEPAPDPTGANGSSERTVVKKTYDRTTGLLLTVTDLQFLQVQSDDRTTILEYEDQLLRLTSVTGPAGETREMVYFDEPGTSRIATRSRVGDGRWAKSEAVHDAFGRLILTRDFRLEGTSAVKTEYDLHGRVRKKSEPYFEESESPGITWRATDYDASGRVSRKYFELADGSTEVSGEFSHGLSPVPGSIGSVLTIKDGSGRSRREIRDSFGRVIRADEPTTVTQEENADLGTINDPAQPTYYEYGKRGGLSVIRQGIQKRIFAYDAFGRMTHQKLPEQDENPRISYHDPDSGNHTWSAAFEYSPTGELLKIISPNGVETDLEYDQHGRILSRSFSDGTPNASYRYDLIANGKGQLIEAENSSTRTRITSFDAAGRPTTYEQRTDGVTYRSQFEYSSGGEVKRITYPSGKTVDQGFGPDGRIRRVGSSQAGFDSVYANSFSYDAAGRTNAFKLGNRLWESANWSETGRLGSLGLGIAPAVQGIWRTEFHYGELSPSGEMDAERTNGAIGRITTIGESGALRFTQNFRYDPGGRLTFAEENEAGDGNWSLLIDHDRYGNRIHQTKTVGNSIEEVDLVPDPTSNRYSVPSGYRYDRNGSVTDDPSGKSYVLDGRNKVIEVRSSGGNLIASYLYDAMGRRIKTITPLETTVFVYAGELLLAEYSTNPSRDRKTRYLTADHLGSTRIVTDGNGELLARRDHFPFGGEITSGIGTRTEENGYLSTTARVRNGFAGMLADPETGLNYADARIYDVGSGRFNSVDPVLSSSTASDPASLNRYTYTLNDPVNLVDPDGLAAIDDWYVSDDGQIEVFRTDDPFDRFFVYDENKNVFVLVAQLNRNKHGLVRFPDSGWGFTNYNPGERGGYDHQTGEYVGQGDHYLLPVTAAALFGFTNQLKNDFGITVALGDMSSSNGSDPWDSKFRSTNWNGHHSTHGHKGNGTGTNIDFRYIGTDGSSRRGNWASSPNLFSRKKNQALFDLAKKWGFTKNFRGTVVPVSGTRAARGHNDHGHLGFDLNRKRASTLFRDRRRYYIRLSDTTLDCQVEQCVTN